MNGQNNNNNTVTDAICGRNAVRELIRSGKPVDKILVQRGEREGSIRLVVAEAVAAGIPVVEVDRHKIASYSPNAQGVCALVPEREYASIDDIFKRAEEKGQPPFIIILDHIADPHNLGAVIRSACCAGAHGVIIPRRNTQHHRGEGVRRRVGIYAGLPRFEHRADGRRTEKEEHLGLCRRGGRNGLPQNRPHGRHRAHIRQ